MDWRSPSTRSSEDVKARDRRVFQAIWRRMMALFSATILIAAIVAGVGGHEVGIVVVLVCLWALLMFVAVIGQCWITRRL